MNTANAVPAVPAVNAQQIAVESTSVETVVLHDNANAAATSALGVTSTYSAIEQLVIEREVWENNAYRTSNDQLYGLLARCYQHYKAMCADSTDAKALREGFNTYVKLKGYKFAKSTHTINKIVQCVFGQDRRRVSSYGIVLRTALAENVGGMDVADFIRSKGGVEEIRLAKSATAMTPKQKAQVASSTVVVNNMGAVGSAALSEKLDAGKIGTNTVLIGTWQADGSIVVRAVVESETALNAALAAHYSAVKAEAAKKAGEEKAAELEAEKQRLAAIAAAKALFTV
jgi:hypothetical protein